MKFPGIAADLHVMSILPMQTRFSWTRALALAFLMVWANQANAQTYEGRQLVQASLVADVSAITPGKPFQAGLLLRIAPHWHTYWKYSGDAGIPIELKWHLPPGWKAGEIRWPIPVKFDDPGDIKTYGYHDEVLLIQELIPPASLGDQPVKLSADASWLVCEKICIPGSAALEITLPLGQNASSANADLFARYQALQPRFAPNLSVKWERNDHSLLLRASSPAFSKSRWVDFYPTPEAGGLVLGHPALESRAGNEAVFRIPVESGGEGISSLPGLIVHGDRADGSDRAGLTISEKPSSSSGTVPLRTPAGRGLIGYLFFGFLGGLILNLMPCVLPVISLKIFGFVQHAGQSRQKILQSGLLFAAGIFAWFLGLALVLVGLRHAGHQITWALQFTNPYFVLAMSAVVLVFALNLLGVFEITLPQMVNRELLGLTASEGGAASFFQGVFATILATPCTAPFLGTALGFAFTQTAPVIFCMFVAVAAGMSAPYIILCAQPGWLRLLPKPGPWMVRVKQLMGFLLLATLIFLLYVLGAQRGLDALVWAAAFLLVLSIVCWMQGVFVIPTASRANRVSAVILMALFLALGGFYFIGNKFAASKLAPSLGATTGDWQSFTPEKLQSELEQGHAVFVDFTAAWCITCKFNEASVLENQAVREAFRVHAVTRLRADWTNGDPVITKLLQHFGRPGVPLYVLYPGKDIEPIVFPELLTKSMVLDKLGNLPHRIAIQSL
jgi:thiol:disulfide interchange protein/DsbC/DsbD-like thiol-disulfide interchange protein